jgi:hypothetical protein
MTLSISVGREEWSFRIGPCVSLLYMDGMDLLFFMHILISLFRYLIHLCVLLVINDNPYGLIFSLSLYEGIAHRNCLRSLYWIQILDAMEIKIYVKYWH